VETVFNPDPHADTSVGWLEFKFFLGAAFSIALACMYLSLAASVPDLDLVASLHPLRCVDAAPVEPGAVG